MKLPSHIRFPSTRVQHDILKDIANNGKEAMHLVTRTLVERSSSAADSSSSSTCSAGDNSGSCQKTGSGGDAGTLAIALGAAIPITCALVVFFFLHRRHIKKQRIEDANDPHRSLDFGVDLVPSTSSKARNGGKPVPEMTITDLGDDGFDRMRPGQKARGVSMDVNPYLLPAALNGSRESIHSMSRSLVDEHDPYRPVTMMRSSSDTKRFAPGQDNASVYSASTMQSANDRANLLRNAQRMSRSDPMGRADSMSPHTSKSSDELPTRQMHSNNRSMPPSRKTSLGSEPGLTSIDESKMPPPPPRKQSLPDVLPEPPLPPQPPVEEMPPPHTFPGSASLPPRKSSAGPVAQPAHASLGVVSAPRESSNYGDDDTAIMPSIPIVNEPEELGYDIDPSMINTGRFSIDTPNLSEQYAAPQPQRVSVMGLRPLPPDVPEDNPEIRANRIRSFYKEYFDDSRPQPAAAAAAHGGYEEDYDASYLDGAIYDPETGGFVMAGRPFAQSPVRRAMTPPPAGASRPGPGFGGPGFGGVHNRHFSTMSAGRGQLRGRKGSAPPMMPKKRLPPPKPLQGLPTPSKLKDYDSVINTPIDFAPPTSFRAMQYGQRADSPLGMERPYSPSVKAFSPLVRSNDELSVMPSPHHLRKSGTFTALDFAPPSRIRDPETASDAGSIRSARSGISALQMNAVRAGAYRVSRIPKEMVTTRDDLASQLRPKMDLTTPA